jgi:hypothetical protein
MLSLTFIDVAIGVGIVVVGDLSRLLYDLHVRDEPY